MAERVEKVLPILGMNFDATYEHLVRGEYLFGYNVRPVGDKLNQNKASNIILGNTLAFTFPTVAIQNKVYRVYLDSSQAAPTLRSLEEFDANGASLGTATYTPTTDDIFTTYADAVTAITGAFTATVGLLVTTGLNTGYFTVEITDNPTSDYILLLTGAAGEPLPFVVQEPVDASLAGALIPMNSIEIDGDVFYWSSNQASMPVKLQILAITNDAGVINVQFQRTPDLVVVNASQVVITGAPPDTGANGTWIIDLVGVDNFDLVGSAFSNTGAGGTVTLNPRGMGEIGVAVKDINDQTWTYTTLIRSSEFNFRLPKPPKVEGERNDLTVNLYWTDNLNPYRKLYYRGAYIDDGAMNFISPLGLYFFGDIYNATRLFQGSSIAQLSYFGQIQSGGNLFAGNYRYVVRFLDEFFNATAWSDPSGIYVVSNNPVEPNTIAIAEQVFGNASTFATPKINQIEVDFIVPNLFKYVELGVLFYSDGNPIPTGTIASRTLLNQTTTQVLQHTGFETDVQSLDINTLLTQPVDILTGLNISIVATRLIPSNTTSHEDVDFSAWVDTFKYSLSMDTIPAIGLRQNGTLQVGEYQVSQNTFGKLAFMINDTYRLAPKFELLNGAFTKNFWFDDIKIDQYVVLTGTQTGGSFSDGDAITYTGGGTGFIGHDSGGTPVTITVYGINNPIKINDIILNGGGVSFTVTGLADPKRELPLPHMNLTNAAADTVYIPRIDIAPDINWDFVVNGTPVRNIVKKIHWEMVEMTPQFQEVLGDGVQVMGVKYELESPQLTGYTHYQTFDSAITQWKPTTISSFVNYFASKNGVHEYDAGTVTTIIFNDPPRQDVTDFIFACGSNYNFRTALAPAGDLDMLYSGLAADMIAVRTLGSFYCQDFLLNQSSYTRQSSDSLVVFGAPNRALVASTGAHTASTYVVEQSRPNLTLFSGWTDTVVSQPVKYSISEAVTINRGDIAPIAGIFYSKAPFKLVYNVDGAIPQTNDVEYAYLDLPNSPVLSLGSSVAVGTAFDDLGVYRAQIYRPKTDKFGDKGNSKYVPTGAVTQYLGTGASIYGDTYVQQNQLKHYRTADFGVHNGDYGIGGGYSWNFSGQEQGLIYYSQNRANSSMVTKDMSSDSARYPVLAENDWLNVNGINGTSPDPSTSNFDLDYKNTAVSFIQIYNSGYNSQQSVSSDVAFDPNLPEISTTPARWWFSLPKPENALEDLYGVIPPLNFRDEDLTLGAINHTIINNGQLICLQTRSVVREFVEDTSLMSTSDVQVVLGDSGVGNRRSTSLSTYGTIHGFGVIKGKSQGGKDITYWIDSITYRVMRFESAGDGTLCISEQYDMRSFFNHELAYASLDVLSIVGMWDEINSEAVWSVMARKEIPPFNVIECAYSASTSIAHSDANKFIGVTVNGIFYGIGVSTPSSDQTAIQAFLDSLGLGSIIYAYSVVMGLDVLQLSSIYNSNIVNSFTNYVSSLGENVVATLAQSACHVAKSYAQYDEVSYVPSTTVTYVSETGVIPDNTPIVFGGQGTGFMGHDDGLGTAKIYGLNMQPSALDTINGGGESFTIVTVTPPVYSTYNKTGEIYISLINGNTAAPDIAPTHWLLVPHFGFDALPNGLYPYDYYNEYTIAFSEKTKRFTAFYTFKPYRYFSYLNFCTPDPIHPSNVYEHNRGSYAEFYDGNNEDAHIKMAWAGDGDLMKTFHAIAMNIDFAPSRIDFSTLNQKTFILNGDVDMENMGDLIVAAVKNDTLTAPFGSADEDTDKPVGEWLITDITMPFGSYNKLEGIDVKFSELSRIYLR